MAKITANTSGLVYSTDHGKMCPACSKPLAKCACSHNPTPLQGDGSVRVSLETKGRKGSGVTIITGLPATVDGLKTLAKIFKQKCGCGGTVKNGIIEIQGDHRDLLMDELQKLGHKVKRTGS